MRRSITLANMHRMNPGDSPRITVVRQDQVTSHTSQTSGSQRQAAICKETNVEAGMWAGTFLVDPGAQTGIHHHGSQETIVYVLAVQSIVQWGDHGEHTVNVEAGDFLHVPAWLVHREINPSKNTPFRWIVIRSSSEPIVVNLPETAWPDRADETQ